MEERRCTSDISDKTGEENCVRVSNRSFLARFALGKAEKESEKPSYKTLTVRHARIDVVSRKGRDIILQDTGKGTREDDPEHCNRILGIRVLRGKDPRYLPAAK